MPEKELLEPIHAAQPAAQLPGGTVTFLFTDIGGCTQLLERLRGWIEADRAFSVWQEGLRAAMRQWQASDQDEGGLLRGAPLVTAEAWQAERGAELSAAERDYIAASVDLRTREQARGKRRRRFTIAGLAGGEDSTNISVRRSTAKEMTTMCFLCQADSSEQARMGPAESPV